MVHDQATIGNYSIYSGQFNMSQIQDHQSVRCLSTKGVSHLQGYNKRHESYKQNNMWNSDIMTKFVVDLTNIDKLRGPSS